MADFKVKGPLNGIKVIDFTIALAGAYTAWQFADLGAEVWKIERDGVGDQARYWEPTSPGMSTLFVSYNKNKQSIEINLGSDEGKQIIYDMVKQADVVLENFKGGSIDRLGLGYDKLKEINPKIVFLSLSGFGGTGPLQKYPCYDAIAEARGGFAGSSGEADGVPMKVGSSICDIHTGQYAMCAALMAMVDARRTGKGCRIDIAMTDVAMQSCEETLMDYGVHGEAQARFGDHDRFIAPYGMFEARDGFVIIIADTEERWATMCDKLGLEALKSDPRFATNADRIANKDALVKEIEAVTVGLRRQAIEDLLLPADVPSSSVLSFIEAYTANHSNEIGLTQVQDQAKLGKFRFYRNSLKFNNEALMVESGAPLLGEHTESILKEVGYTDEQIKEMFDNGIVCSTLI